MIGVFAVGMIITARIILAREMNAGYAATNPRHALLVTDGVDEQFLRAIRRVDGVKDATGRSVLRARVPPSRGILLEQTSLPLVNAEIGDELTVITPNERQRDLQLGGLVYDPSLPPAQFLGMAVGFINFETLEWFGVERLLTEITITVSEKADDVVHIQQVANDVESLLERNNIPVRVVFVPPPGVHPVAAIVDAVTGVLVILGAVSLIIAAILIFNTMSALLTQQTMQIGIMKSMGADSRQLYGICQSFYYVCG